MARGGGVFRSMLRGLLWPFGIVVCAATFLFVLVCLIQVEAPNATKPYRSVFTAGFGGRWATDSPKTRPMSPLRFPALRARASPAGSACTRSPASCSTSCPGGCRAPWATRCPAPSDAPSPRVTFEECSLLQVLLGRRQTLDTTLRCRAGSDVK